MMNTVQSERLDETLSTYFRMKNSASFGNPCMYSFFPEKNGISFSMCFFDEPEFSFTFDGSLDDFIDKGRKYYKNLVEQNPGDDSYFAVFCDQIEDIALIRDRDLHLAYLAFNEKPDFADSPFHDENSDFEDVIKKYKDHHMFVGTSVYFGSHSPQYNVLYFDYLLDNEAVVMGYFRNVHEFVHDMETAGIELSYMTQDVNLRSSLFLKSYDSCVAPFFYLDESYKEKLNSLLEQQYHVGFRDILADDYGKSFVKNGLYFPAGYEHSFSSTLLRRGDTNVSLKAEFVPGVLTVHKEISSDVLLPDFDTDSMQKVRLDGQKVCKLLGCEPVVLEQGKFNLQQRAFCLTDSKLRAVCRRLSDGSVRYSPLLYTDMETVFAKTNVNVDVLQAFEDLGLDIRKNMLGPGCTVMRHREYPSLYSDMFYPYSKLYMHVGSAVADVYHFAKTTDFAMRARDCYACLKSGQYDNYDGLTFGVAPQRDGVFNVSVSSFDEIQSFYKLAKKQADVFVESIDALFLKFSDKLSKEQTNSSSKDSVIIELDDLPVHDVGHVPTR